MAYTDWQDHDDHDDGGYTDHHDHSDDDCDYTDWIDHDDGSHTDHDDHDDGGAHVDWSDHSDSPFPHLDWDDWTDGGGAHVDHDDGGHLDVPYSDWTDHGDNEHSDDTHEDWDDYDDNAYPDWTDHDDWTDHGDASPHTDWTDYDDLGPHGDWTNHTDSGSHTDWNDYNDHDDHSDHTDGHTDWSDGHSDWDDYNDIHFDHTDHSDVIYTDSGPPYSHIDWTNHSDSSGDPHGDWDDHDDATPHTDWTNYNDGGPHGDWSNYTDTGSHTDWGDHNDWDDHSDHTDGAYTDWTDHTDGGGSHADWTDHGDGAYSDWTDAHIDYTDHDDGGPHGDWDDHNDGGHSDWDDHNDGGVDEGKTRVSAWIDDKDVSCYIIGADIERDALNGIGRWELILDNQGHWWGSAFSVDDDITIHINGSLMMKGYVDDISPYIDTKGEYTEFIKVSGRDYGMDLAQLYVTQNYPNGRADDTIDATLTLAASEITYTSPAAAPIIDYEFDRTYLADGIRDVAKLVDYDIYVQDDINRTLHFFDIATMGGGIEHTVVDLTSVAGAATNNILRLEIGENIGFDVKNYVEAHAGDLNDHYTDLNFADWAGGANVAVTEDSVLFLRGNNAIRMTTTAPATVLYMELTFPRYNHPVLDMSEPDTGKYIAQPHNTTTLNKQTRLRLRDTAGNWIRWFSITPPGAASPPLHETTDNVRNDAWRFIEFPYGWDTEIKIAGSVISGTWAYVAPAVTFNWNLVDRIRFTDDPAFPQNNGDYIVIDGLEIPAVEVISVQQDAASIALYGTRMKEFYRPDIKNQVELDAYATDQLPKFKDPVQSVKITAIGQVDSNYAAQSLDVQAPSSGIAALTRYRIFTLHHSVKLSPLQNEIAGYDFITEYELIKNEIDGTDQPIDPTRVSVTHSPTRSMMRGIRQQERYNKTIRRIR